MKPKRMSYLVLCVLLIILLGLVGYWVGKKNVNSEFHLSDALNDLLATKNGGQVEAEIIGISKQVLVNESEVNELLKNISVWDGVKIDSLQGNNVPQYAKPKGILIKFTTEEYPNTLTRWSDGTYAASTKTEMGEGGIYILWVGLNPKIYDNPAQFAYWSDRKIIQGLASRTQDGMIRDQAAIESLIQGRSGEEPLVKLENDI